MELALQGACQLKIFQKFIFTLEFFLKNTHQLLLCTICFLIIISDVIYRKKDRSEDQNRVFLSYLEAHFSVAKLQCIIH